MQLSSNPCYAGLAQPELCGLGPPLAFALTYEWRRVLARNAVLPEEKY
jgi:hypothetical protein